MKRLALFAVALLMACFPPLTLTPTTTENVTQQAAGIGQPTTTTVGQYPAFSEYTSYAQQSSTYAQWYADAERCGGQRGGGVAGMRFLVAMTPLFRVDGGPLLVGSYWRDGRTVMVGLGLESDSLAIRHEMLHDILALPDSTPGGATVHPPNIFPRRGDTASRATCAGVVSPSH